MKFGGWIFIIILNVGGFWYRLLGFFWYYYKLIEYLIYFFLDMIKFVLEKSGFFDVELKLISNLMSLGYILNRLKYY